VLGIESSLDRQANAERLYDDCHVARREGWLLPAFS